MKHSETPAEKNPRCAIYIHERNEQRRIPIRTMDLLADVIMRIRDDGSYACNLCTLPEYLLCLAAMVETEQKKYQGIQRGKCLSGTEEPAAWKRRIDAAFEGISRDIHDAKTFHMKRQACKNELSPELLQKLEESLGVDSRGLDQNPPEYLFGKVDAQEIGATAMVLQRYSIVERYRESRSNGGKAESRE